MVEHGLYMKHLKVEVYLLGLKLSMYSNQSQTVFKEFSRADTVGKVGMSEVLREGVTCSLRS